MQKWSDKSWFFMIVHQSDFEAEFKDCDDGISDCLAVFTVSTLVHQKEDEKWQRNLEESLDADHKDIMRQLSAVGFKQRVVESNLTECRDDIKALSTMMQRGLAGHGIVSEEEQKRMAKNLYDLLQLSNQLPPDCQLDGMVEWSGEATPSGQNADMYKGRYLHSQDVRIKVIHSVNAGDKKSIKALRREVELWATAQEKDHGKHIIPFYGFFTPDGLRLALVSPWMKNGDALAYVKANEFLDYKQLIIGIAEGIKVLHCMDPPIIHGNLRAENVLIGDEGQPLITDFALAKASYLDGNLITQTSGVSDSCRWSAPEMFEEQATVSCKGDIYSFGMTILQLFTHDKPYANRKTLQVLNKKVVGALPDRPGDLLVTKHGLDDKMWDLLCRCWWRDPEGRPSIDELIPELSNVL
ncbi:kinase-like domain-containing protein [Amanita rubescens]|nr:kinase-like domain-containing protein [Amanita rubescens]